MRFVAPERAHGEEHDVALAERRVHERGVAGHVLAADELARQQQIVGVGREREQDARSGRRAWGAAAAAATRATATRATAAAGAAASAGATAARDRSGRRRRRAAFERRQAAAPTSAAGCRRRRLRAIRRRGHRGRLRHPPPTLMIGPFFISTASAVWS